MNLTQGVVKSQAATERLSSAAASKARTCSAPVKPSGKKSRMLVKVTVC